MKILNIIFVKDINGNPQFWDLIVSNKDFERQYGTINYTLLNTHNPLRLFRLFLTPLKNKNKFGSIYE